MALTKKQLAERKKGIGASDAAKIANGDWYDLWAEKTGAKEGEDLSRVFAVQLGSVTEELNLLFYGYKTGHTATRQGEAVISKEYPFLRCTLDGYDPEDAAVIECKHVNGYSKMDDLRARYFPQVQHQMLVTGEKRAVLSVIIGTSEPALELIERDDFWINEYVEKAASFWGYVERKEAPPQGAPVEAPPPPAVMRTVDMTGNNSWTALAADWTTNAAGAKKFADAAKALKELVALDVREAYGAGIKITRDKRGLTIKEK